MRARRRLLLASIVVGVAIAGLAVHSDATLENQVFSSRVHRVKLTVPRGWRASDQSSYPGVLLWMRRSKPPGMMLLTSEPIDDATYCAWPPQCRQQSDVLAAQYACALAARLEPLGFRVGPVQAGPRDGELAAVWIEYDDGKRFLRQAVASDDAMVHTLILSTSSAAQRASHGRSFDQALRSMHALEEDEIEPPAARGLDAAADATSGAAADAGSGSAAGAASASASASGSAAGAASAAGSAAGTATATATAPATASGSAAGSASGSAAGSASGSAAGSAAGSGSAVDDSRRGSGSAGSDTAPAAMVQPVPLRKPLTRQCVKSR